MGLQFANRQSKQPEKHSQDKRLPNCNTRIKIPTSGPLSKRYGDSSFLDFHNSSDLIIFQEGST